MTISGNLPIFLIGCFGGLIGEVLKWFQLRESPNLPTYSRNVFYWFITVLLFSMASTIEMLYWLLISAFLHRLLLKH